MVVNMTEEVKVQLLTAMKKQNKEAVRILFSGFGKQGPNYVIQFESAARSSTDMTVVIDGVKYILQREYQFALKEIEILFEDGNFVLKRKTKFQVPVGSINPEPGSGEVVFGINPKNMDEDI